MSWTDNDIRILEKYYEDQEIIPEYIMIKMSAFRSWDTIKRKASTLGLKRKSGWKSPHTDEFLLSEIRRFYKAYDKVPTHDEFAKHPDFPSTKGIKKRFKTWNNAIKLAGLRINLIRYHKKDNVIEEAKSFYRMNKRSPFYNELAHTRTIVYNYWNTWDEMLLEAGLPPTPKTFGIHTKDKNGNIHKSKIEASISNVLIDNKLKFTTENRYDEFVECDNNFLFDWVIDLKGNKVFVEYFGLNSNWDRKEIDKYKARMYEKIQLCVESGLILIVLDQNDLVGNFDNLIKKFKHTGIGLEVRQEHVDSIGYRIKKIAI